jgi:hypothetical protein
LESDANTAPSSPATATSTATPATPLWKWAPISFLRGSVAYQEERMRRLEAVKAREARA